MTNTTLTLAIPKEIKLELNKYPEINWSQETRTFLKNRLETLKLTKKVEKLTQNNEYNLKTIDETLTKLLKEGKLNMSEDFSDIYAHSMESLKELYKDEDDKEWKEIIKKNTYKKK